ncbi:MAG: biopolymer transporter ExbD [Thermodesulfobacteriota bacterium]|nr:biopolymer transporter ExbD [Thermodesulfobacteriota bacterium]
MQFKIKPREDPVIEITPLIDVVFLLLLFFMVTTRFISLPGLKVTLPGIKPGSMVTATSKIEVQITVSGDIYVAGNPVSPADLPAALKKNAPDPASAVVILMADEKVSHGRVVSIMDVIRRQGLKRVVLAARWDKEPASR